MFSACLPVFSFRASCGVSEKGVGQPGRGTGGEFWCIASYAFSLFAELLISQVSTVAFSLLLGGKWHLTEKVSPVGTGEKGKELV